MQMRMTYLAAEHKDISPGSSVSTEAFDPDAGVITTELNSKLYNEHLNEMAEQGYQLLSVQPVHRVEYTHIQNISVIGGFYFFWQKASALAFPMTSEAFPGFPATKTATQAPPKVAAPVRKVAAAKPAPIDAAVPIRAKDSQDLSFSDTDISTYKSASTGSNNNTLSNDNNERFQEPVKDTNDVDSRVSTIKKLLQEKSSGKDNKLNPQSIEIPPEANTQLLKNIEDLHDLGRTATSRKDKNPGTPKKSKADSKPDLNSETDEHLDLDLDFDF